MTQIYLVHSTDDADFAQHLATDLLAQGLNVATGDPDTNEQFAALHRATHVIVVLSEAAIKDAKLISTLSTTADLKQKMIAVRTGPVKTMPRQLKGIPLDFSDPETYQDSFEALMDDLRPPVKHEPVLPQEIQTALRNDDAVARRDAVIALGLLRNTPDMDVRDLAEQTLRDLVFKDPESNIKALARSTLQLFQGMNPEADTPQLSSYITQKASESDASETTEAVSTPSRAPTSPIQQPVPVVAMPLWQSPQWKIVPAFGLVIAVLQALATHNIAYAISGVLVWLIFPYLNVVIRDGGRMAWDMPAPVVAGGIIGLILGIVGLLAGSFFNEINGLDIVIAAVSGSVSGGFIGWLSSLRCDSV
ncbi:MAG: toll/interleukin-1 receptor domain-containing protein [Chloroflexi bacterium]|nr:toll/interleukin-1 receptor domain-containing protein [Chloroflexota bacterium]